MTKWKDIPDIIGSKEAAEILGWLNPKGEPNVNKVSMYRIRANEKGYPPGMIPKPLKVLACGPIWVKEDIEKYRNEVIKNKRRTGSGD